MREFTNHFREALQNKETLGEANFSGHDIEAVYTAGHEAVHFRMDKRRSCGFHARWKLQMGFRRLQSLGETWAKTLQAIRAQEL